MGAELEKKEMIFQGSDAYQKQSIFVFSIGLVHCALTPIALAITVRFDTDPIFVWTVPFAQCILAMLYLAFGPGAIAIRFPLASFVLALVIVGVAWSYDVLEKVMPWDGLPPMVAHVLVPLTLTGLFLSLLRPFLGSLAVGSTIADSRITLADLMVATLCVAVVLALYRFGAVSPLYDDVLSSVIFAALGTCCFMLVMGKSPLYQLIGGTAFLPGLAIISPIDFVDILPWIIVGSTLGVLRIAGVKVR